MGKLRLAPPCKHYASGSVKLYRRLHLVPCIPISALRKSTNHAALLTKRVCPQADGLLRRMLGNTDQAADQATAVTRQPRWRKVEPLAKSYLGNTLHLLGAELCTSRSGLRGHLVSVASSGSMSMMQSFVAMVLLVVHSIGYPLCVKLTCTSPGLHDL